VIAILYEDVFLVVAFLAVIIIAVWAINLGGWATLHVRGVAAELAELTMPTTLASVSLVAQIQPFDRRLHVKRACQERSVLQDRGE
jgi:hypothetical protein